MSNDMIETILKSRYYHENEHCWNDICARVSNFIGNSCEEKKAFYRLMSEKKFVPNSPCLFNAGTKYPMLSACFCLNLEDDLRDIFDKFAKSALIYKYGGGCGFAFGDLRAKNAPVSAGGRSSGVLSFLAVEDQIVSSLSAGGRRRGAALACVTEKNGDILDFITCKLDQNQINNFNLSVMVSNHFMELVKNKKWNEIITYKIEEDGSKIPVTCGEIWKLIVRGAHTYGDPCLLFDDTINADNKLIDLGRIKTTNPCGEQPLRNYESCNLGSINISKYVINDKFDFEEFDKDVAITIRFLDNVIDKNWFPFEELYNANQASRKIGLGLMGYADTLIKLRLPYDSDNARVLLGNILNHMKEVSINTSVELAKEKGVFPLWEKSEWCKQNVKIRNCNLMTIAPTGSISLIAECSASIEPVFNWVTKRSNTCGQTFLMVHPLFEADLRKMVESEDDYNEIINDVYTHGTVQDLPYFDDKFKSVYKCALDVKPMDRIKTQSIAQSYVDASISSTINLPNESTEQDVENIFIKAWESGCKGITVYRSGSRQNEVLSNGKDHYKYGFTEIIKDGKVWKKCNNCGEEFESDAHCVTCPNCGSSFCG